MTATDRPYNMTADDYVIKYTINIPVSLYGQITRKARKLGYGHKSDWIRQILLREVVNEKPVSMTELMRIEQQGKIYEPPKRYSGFVDGLLRNSFRLRWFKRKTER